MRERDLAPPGGTAALQNRFDAAGLHLRNRIVMAPMTRAMSPGGIPGPDVAEYYARRATGGVGLIITEGTVVGHPTSSSREDIPRFHGDALPAWQAVVNAVHAENTAIVPQLWHVGWDPLHWGRDPAEVPGPAPSSPSGIDPGSGNRLTPMSVHDIENVIHAFADAALAARRIGFDGIELHAAHGYLIDQFLWNETNHRTDWYGGSTVRERTRFACEVIAACRRAVGPKFPIVVRISQWKVGHYRARLAHGPAELAELLEPLVAAGADVFHCSQRRFWQPEFDGSPLNLAGWAKKVTGKPTITVGSVGLADSDFLGYLDGKGAATADVDEVCARLEEGEFDLVAVGRALIADPEWPNRVRSGHPTRAFDAAMLHALQ
ncbi:NADH:flavin oxidoreductase [Amycolatopsis ultiminotia]|uniref:NADH:flavin oxidoreductase n=1 Tax=Amycolatopsis ultiminotia TaxID=543629 RepID=UPI0031E8D561